MPAPPAPLTLEFPDSEVREIVATADAVTVHFSAAALWRAPGAPRVGHVRAVTMAVRGAQVCGPLKDGIGTVAEGRLGVDGVSQATVPLPHAASGAITLSLRFANGTQLVITGDAFSCRGPDEPRVTESLAC